MFEVKVDWIIRKLHDKLIPRESGSPDAEGYHKGFVMTFNHDVSFYSERGSIECKRTMHVLICAPHHAFVHIVSDDSTQRHFNWKTVPLNLWENIGNHDSCWIDSLTTKINTLYFEMCGLVNDKIAPKDLSTFSSFGFSDMWTDVLIKRQLDTIRNAKHGSSNWYQITEVKLGEDNDN